MTITINRYTALAASLAAVLSAAPAAADGDSATLTLDVAGRISPACNIEMQPGAKVGDVARAGQAEIPFSLACNRPLAWEMRSQNGGLRHEQLEGYVVPYAASLGVGETAVRAGRLVNSGDMHDQAMTDDLDGHIPFSEQGRLLVQWDAPDRMLASGVYRDVLTITITVEGQ